jgi:hypothetical protein
MTIAAYIARGRFRAGSRMSCALKAMTPKPRNAKKVSATLPRILRNSG